MNNIDDNKTQDDMQNEEEAYYGVGNFLWEVIKVFFWALVIIIPIRVFLFQPFFVQGESMEPNFKDGDYLIINELGYKHTEVGISERNLVTVNAFKKINRNDVIVFRYPNDRRQFFIKRVIGLPGERVKIEEGKVVIYNEQNPEGFVLEEQYLTKNLYTKGSYDVELDEEHYYVLGDNRNASSDSRVWGPLPANDIMGRVLIRAWPLNKAEIM